MLTILQTPFLNIVSNEKPNVPGSPAPKAFGAVGRWAAASRPTALEPGTLDGHRRSRPSNGGVTSSPNLASVHYFTRAIICIFRAAYQSRRRVCVNAGLAGFYMKKCIKVALQLLRDAFLVLLIVP